MRNGIAKLIPRKEFDLIIANFSRRDWSVRKNAITEYAIRNPLWINILSEELDKMYAEMLYIEQQSPGSVEHVFSSRLKGFHYSVVRLDSEGRWEGKGKGIVNRKGREALT